MGGMMLTERLSRGLILALVIAGAPGCASTSVRSDTRSVAGLTRAQIADVADADVDPELPAEARALLEKPLDVESALRIALISNRELRAELREMGIPRGRLVQAGLVPNPSFEVELLPERTSAYSLRVEYDLTGLILAPIRARAAGPEVDAARLETAGSVVDLGYHVRAAFYAVVAAQEQLAIANRWLDAFAASRDAARAITGAGNVRKLDFEVQDASYQEARVEVADIELAANEAREALTRVLALHGSETGFTVAATLPPLPPALEIPDGLETRVLRASFDLQAKKSRLEAVGRSAGLARVEGWLPDIVVDGHVLEPRAGVAGLDANTVYSGGVRLSVPIFDRKQGAAAGLEAEFDGLLERYYGAANDLRSRARISRAHLTTAHGRALLFQNGILPTRSRVTQESILQYNAMQISVFRLLLARRDELSAQLAEIDAKRAYWTARAALDALLAGGRVPPDDDHATKLKSEAGTGGD